MKTSFFRIVLFLTIIGFTQSCTALNTRFIKVSSQNYQPTEPDKVEVYLTKVPNRDYEEIAIVYFYTTVDRNSLLYLKKAAAQLGADAVIHVTGGYRTVTGVAVKWK